MDLWKYHENHFRLKKVKKYWERGQKYLAIQSFLFSLPCFLFPFADEEGRRGAFGYDYCWRVCRSKHGVRGMNSIKCWRLYFWRQVIHFLGGFLVSVPLALPIFFIFDFYLWMFFVPLIVGGFAIAKEIMWDDRYERAEIEKEYGEGISEFKHFTDVLFWITGSASFCLILTMVSGVRF